MTIKKTETESSPREVRILIVEDHSMFREGLVSILNSQPDITVVGEADNGSRAVELALDLLPDIVLMDISLPDISGMEVTRKILAKSPAIKVMVLSMHSNKEYVGKMMRVGASGYVVKDCNSAELIRGIRAVVDGKAYLCPEVAGIVIEEYTCSDSKTPTHMHLTLKEREVLQFIADGVSTKQIASRLDVSPKTVETHRRRLMRKLDIFNVAQLTKYAVRQGLTSLES